MFIWLSHAAEPWNPVLLKHSESFSKPCIPNNELLTHKSVVPNCLTFSQREGKMTPTITSYKVGYWPSMARSLGLWQAAPVQAPCPRGQQKARGREWRLDSGNSRQKFFPKAGSSLGLGAGADGVCFLHQSVSHGQKLGWWGCPDIIFWSSSESLHFKIT